MEKLGLPLFFIAAEKATDGAAEVARLLAERAGMSGGQAKRKADEAKAAMAYMRRLHGDPATAPAGDLADADYDAADVALGPEGEGLDGGHENNNTQRQAQCCNRYRLGLARAISPIVNM